MTQKGVFRNVSVKLPVRLSAAVWADLVVAASSAASHFALDRLMGFKRSCSCSLFRHGGGMLSKTNGKLCWNIDP